MAPRSAPSHPRTCAEASPLQSTALEAMSAAGNYIDWLAALAEPHLGDRPLEVGAGLGDHVERWVRPGRVVTASEADPHRLAVLRQRFAGRADVVVRELTAPVEETGDHTAVVALNVLEHVEDDVAALRSFAGLVRPGGRVVLVVPAFMVAMSDFDRAVGHHRRYTRRTLRRALVAAGLRPVRLHYVNAVGLVGWIVLMRLMHRRTDQTPLGFFDRRLVPVLRAAEARVHPPFGQSVLAVAEVPLR
ncbi:class I SAM-dependent methyltransferase [Geodermatophilus sp. SYSU D00703]